MKRRSLILLVAMMALLFLLGVQEPETAVQAQATNLLKNPGFEGPYSPNNNGGAPDWIRWHRESDPSLFGDCTNGYRKMPRWGMATDFVYEGSASQYIGNNWDTWSGGMWQNVSVTPGATYEFSFYARGRGSMEPAPAPSYTGLRMNIRAGIDPNGSGLWLDNDVVWGPAGDAHDQWVRFSVQATATGNTITVFTSADWAVQGVNQCYRHLDTYYDAAQLVMVSPPATNTPPPPPPPPPATNTPLPPTPTFTPEFTPPPTETPTITPSPTPTGGRVCVNAFADENGNGVRDPNEGYMAGVTFSVASSERRIGEAISAGTETPFCFEGVPAGTYQVTQFVPGALEMTTAASATIDVQEGSTIGLEFGSRLRPRQEIASSATSSPGTLPGDVVVPTAVAPAPAPDSSPPNVGTSANALAWVGLGVLVLAVLLLGGLLLVVLRRG